MNEAGNLENVSARNQRVLGTLADQGERNGFVTRAEYPVPGGRVDLVWLQSLPEPLATDERLVPVVGFEIESSWRTRKPIKGDYLNLYDLGAALGVIVLLGEGPDVEAARQFAQTLVERSGPRILVWSEDDVEHLAGREAAADPSSAVAAPEQRPAPTPGSSERGYAGKYRALWQWLRSHPPTEIRLNFDDIEEVIGFPLPASSRKYAAHWHSYDGSAVVRAIQDAGWDAHEVSLGAQTLVLRPLPWRQAGGDTEKASREVTGVAAAESVSGSRIPDAALEAAIGDYFASSRSDWGLTQQQWLRTCRLMTDTMERWARVGHTDFYSILARDTDLDGHPAWHHALSEMLAVIARASNDMSLPMITAVVYGKASNEPGPGFNAAAKNLGRQSPGQENIHFWIKELQRVYATWSAG